MSLVGMLTMGFASGCNLAKQNLTDEQINNLITIADNADTFMGQTLDLLEGENEKLDFEQAYRLFKLATTGFDLNANEVRNNLVMESYNAEKVNYRVYYYKNENGENHRIAVDVNDENIENPTMSIYEVTEEGTRRVYKFNGYEIDEVSSKYHSVDAYVVADGDSLFSNTFSYNKEEINSVVMLENGNYLITFCRNNINLSQSTYSPDMEITKFEITKDAKIVNVSTDSMYAYKWDDGEIFYNCGYTSAKLIYGEINDAKIEELINLITEEVQQNQN